MMKVEALKRTAALVGERSVSAIAEARSEATSAAVGHVRNPEVAQIAKRRKFTNEYKLKILKELEICSDKTGVVLRREGLYSSSIAKWRRWQNQMKTNEKSSKNKQLHNEIAKLHRENKRMGLKLKKAEGIIELQKKTSELLNLMSKSSDEEN